MRDFDDNRFFRQLFSGRVPRKLKYGEVIQLMVDESTPDVVVVGSRSLWDGTTEVVSGSHGLIIHKIDVEGGVGVAISTAPGFFRLVSVGGSWNGSLERAEKIVHHLAQLPRFTLSNMTSDSHFPFEKVLTICYPEMLEHHKITTLADTRRRMSFLKMAVEVNNADPEKEIIDDSTFAVYNGPFNGPFPRTDTGRFSDMTTDDIHEIHRAYRRYYPGLDDLQPFTVEPDLLPDWVLPDWGPRATPDIFGPISKDSRRRK